MRGHRDRGLDIDGWATQAYMTGASGPGLGDGGPP
jgi:hypothetical protein